MGIRETLNQNSGFTSGVTVGIILVAIGLAVWRVVRPEPGFAPASEKAYFTDDDGKSFFVDDRMKVPPFQHNGKTASGAELFTCDGGKTKFIGWLRRYTPEAKKRREEFLTMNKSQPGALMIMMEDADGIEIKKPGTGENAWVRQSDPIAQQIYEIRCPDGSGNIPDPVPPP